MGDRGAEAAAAAAAGGTTARMYASVADAIHPPVAPRSRFVAGGLRSEALTAAAAPIGPAPRAALAESTRARLRSATAAAPVAATNLGFRMLAKAGWREGTGLGAKAQGPLEPVAAFQKSNRAGVGAETATSLQVVGAPERPPPPPRPPRPQPQRAAAEDGGPPKTDKELSAEQLAAYVRKRARDAAIQRGMFRAFADDGAEGSGGDANPLTRRRTGGADRLRDTNPLRGMFTD